VRETTVKDMTRISPIWRTICWVPVICILAAGCGDGSTTVIPDLKDQLAPYDVDGGKLDSVHIGKDLGPADLETDVIPVSDISSLELNKDFGGTECEEGEGCFLAPCKENKDCISGWCVEHLGESVCSIACQEECPAG